MSSLLANPDRAVHHAAARHPEGDTTRIIQLEHEVEGLTRALHSRDVIGQAKGILIAYYNISADDAFMLLVQVSQHTNTKLAEIAAVLVTRVRECGPAQPQQCQVVTEAIEGILAGSEREAMSHPG
jgi:hypothetical protein